MSNLTTFGANSLLAGTGLPEDLWVKLHLTNPGPDALDGAATMLTRMLVERGLADDGISVSVNALEWGEYPATEDIAFVSFWDAETAGNPWLVTEIDGGPIHAEESGIVVIEPGDVDISTPIHDGGGGEGLMAPYDMGYTLNLDGDAATVDWSPIDGATGYEIQVAIDGGDPQPYDPTIVPAFDYVAPASGDYEFTARSTAPLGERSDWSEPLEVPLGVFPGFQEGVWPAEDVPGMPDNVPMAILWFATYDGKLIVHEVGYDDVEEVGVVALAEWQLNTDGPPTHGAVHVMPWDDSELIPIKRDGDVVFFVRRSYEVPECELVAYDLASDTVVDSLALTYNWVTKFVWDADNTLVGVTQVSEGDPISVQVAVLETPFAPLGETTFDELGLVASLVMAERMAYVLGTDELAGQIVMVDVSDRSAPFFVRKQAWEGLIDQTQLTTAGPGWVVVNSKSDLQTWDVNDPAFPVLGDTLDLSGNFQGDDYDSRLGSLQFVGDHAIEYAFVQGGSIAALLDGTTVLLYGPTPDTTGFAYGLVDVSTPEARAALTLTDYESDTELGDMTPQARIGPTQTVGMVWDEDVVRQQVFVAGIPAYVPAPIGPWPPEPVDLEEEVNTGGNQVVVTWPPVDQGTSYEVVTGVDGGPPQPVGTVFEPEVVFNAPAEGEYEIAVRTCAPGGRKSAYSTPVVVELVATPAFQTGVWQVEDITGGTEPAYQSLWFGDQTGKLFIYEWILGVDASEILESVLVEYQLNEVGDPTIGTEHVIPTTGGHTKRPVKRLGDTIWLLRVDEDEVESFLSSFDLDTDTYISSVEVPWAYGQINSWDAASTFVSVSQQGPYTALFCSVDMSNPASMPIGYVEIPGLLETGALHSVFVTEGYAYVTCTDSDAYGVVVVIDVSDPTEPTIVNTQLWEGDPYAAVAAIGAGWAVLRTPSEIQSWNLHTPAYPVLVDTLAMGDFNVGSFYQQIGDHGIDGSGAVAALVGGTHVMIGGQDIPDPFDPGPYPPAYGYVDVSTATARANLTLSGYVSNAAWGVVYPFARIGTDQTVGMIYDDAASGFERQWLVVADTPSTFPPPEAAP